MNEQGNYHLASSGRLRPVLLPGILLGVAGTFVAAIAPLLQIAALPLSLAFLAAISVVGIAVSAWTRRADWWLAMLIVILAMFPNSTVNPDLRILGGGFRIFTRSVMGALSMWDVLLGILLILAFWMYPRRRQMPRGPDWPGDVFLFGILMVCVAGAMNGFVHAWILNYGPTSFRSVVQQSLPIFYLFASLLIGRLALDSQGIWKVIWAVRLSTVAVLVQGVLLLFLASRDQFTVMRGFLGIPIVLYDQLTVLNVFVCFALAQYVAGQKLKSDDWVMLAGGVLFMLMSTRRLVLIMLLFNIGFVFVLAVRRGNVFRGALRMFLGTFAVASVVVAVASVAAPKLVEAIGWVVGSVNLTSEIGQQQGGALRMVELENIAGNLGHGLTPSWVVGRGLGTYWQEFVPTGLNLDVGTTAFVESQLQAGARGWWPGFHLPFISLVYRFGVLGTIAIWVLVLGWVLRGRASMRSLAGERRAFAVMAVVLMTGVLLAIGETIDSAGNALLGLLVASLGGLRTSDRTLESAEPEGQGDGA